MKARGIYSVLLVLIMNFSPAFGQVPSMENGDECLDWFLLCWNEMEKCHAVAGRADNAHSNGTNFEQTEWFEIKCTSKITKERLHYCEQRHFSFGDPGSKSGVPWKRTLRSKSKLLIASGARNRALDAFEPPVYDSNGKLISGVRFSNEAPNAFSMAVLTGSGIDMSEEFNNVYFTKTFSKMKKVDEGKDSRENFRLFAFDQVNSRELIFDKENAMPIVSRGFFRDKTMKGEVDKTHFPVLNFEAKTSWERLEDGKTYAPTRVDNFVHQTSPLKKTASRHVQLVVAYDTTDVNDEILSDENLQRDTLNEGPISALRDKLFKKVDERIKKHSSSSK